MISIDKTGKVNFNYKTMARIISSIWQTVDGIIDSSTMDKWFAPFHSDARGKYINDIIQDCEAMLYGRLTYEMLASYWAQQKNNEFGVADKLNNTKKYLVSTTLKQADWGETAIISNNVPQEVRKLRDRNQGNILMQGSASLVNLLIKEKLLDELRLLTNPYIGGTGKRLFEDEINQVLQLIEERKIDNGVIISIYQFKY